MDELHLLQWPAMIITIVATWLTASQTRRTRLLGFWSFLASNVLWVIWGWHDEAYAIVVMQIALTLLNIRGAWKNESATGTQGVAANPPR